MKPTTDEQAFAALLEGMHADAPHDLARLAALAKALEHVRPTTGGPSTAFRASLRNRLLVETAVRTPWVRRVRSRWAERNARMTRSFRIVFANAAAAALMLAGGSIVAVAQTAVPGDWDYWAKRLHEDARLLVTRAPEPRAYLQMDLARERLNEIRELINRSQHAAGPYAIALNDMDARTLDATKLLITLYGKTHDRSGLDRLTQFATAQRAALEVLVERMPAAARPPARDSIAILERVSQRVVGIVGGCICPANALLPQSGGGDRGGAGGTGSSPTGTQAPLCPCAQFRGDDSTPSGGTGGKSPGAQQPKEPAPPPAPPPDCEPGEPCIDLPELPVVDDTVDDIVNDLIDTVLEPLPELPVPAATISVPDPLGN